MGAGKSRILCEKAWWLAFQHPGCQIGIFRKVAASLSATTERTFWRDVADVSKIIARNKTENWVEVEGGSRIYFMGLDADSITGVPSKVGSLDLAFAFVDEAVELNEQDWLMLQGRLRDPRSSWHQIAAATNPAGPTHWLKRRFTPSTSERKYLAASSNRFLPEDYQQRLADLPDTVFGRRLGKGEWAAAEGNIYDLPMGQIVVPDITTEWKRKVGGIDWGFTHAFACELIGQTGSGRMAVIDEIYEKGLTIDELIPALLYMQEQHHVDYFVADPSEPAYIAQCKRKGIKIVPANNAVGPGIQAVQTAIKGGMTINPSCEGLLNEMPQYRWATNRGTGLLKEEPVKENDDAVDALRYAVFALSPGNQRGFSAVQGPVSGVA